MAKSKTQALADLAQAEVGERQKQREAELAAARAREAADQARSALVDAHVTEKGVGAAEKARERALKLADDATIQGEAAQRRLDRAGQERRRFEVVHARELIDELGPAAEQAVRKIEHGIRALVEGNGEWHVVAQRVSALLRELPGASPRDAPSDHELGGAVRDLKQVLTGGLDVTSPLPHWAHHDQQLADEAVKRDLRLERDRAAA
jgi:hypothetical protein